MGLFGVFKNGHIGVAGISLSDHCREFSIDHTIAELPNNCHGNNTEIKVAGLETWTITAKFLQDFASNKVDSVLSAYGVGHTPFGIEVGADATSTVSTTNPRYSGLAILTSYKPVMGPQGSNLEADATFKCAGDLTRRTA